MARAATYIFTASQNVQLSQFADRELFDFESLKADEPSAEECAIDDKRLDVVNLTLVRLGF